MKDENVVIMWESKLTGFRGMGSLINKEEAEHEIKKADEDYPDIEHWIEEVTDLPTPSPS